MLLHLARAGRLRKAPVALIRVAIALLTCYFVPPVTIIAKPVVLVSEQGWVDRLQLSSDDETLVSLVQVPHLNKRTSISIWDVSTKDPEEEPKHVLFSPDGSPASNVIPPRLWDVAFDPSEPVLYAVGEVGRYRWSTKDFSLLSKKKVIGPKSVAFSPAGVMAISYDNGRIYTYAGAYGKPLAGHLVGPWHIGWSPDGKRLASASADGTAFLWNLETGDQTLLDGHRRYAYESSFSPDGELLATGDNGFVRIWNGKTGAAKQLLQVDGEQVRAVLFSPDGRRIAAAADNRVEIWNTSSWKREGVLRGHQSYVNCFAYSSDGQKLYSGAQDSTIRIWNLSEEIRTAQQRTTELETKQKRIIAANRATPEEAFKTRIACLVAEDWASELECWTRESRGPMLSMLVMRHSMMANELRDVGRSKSAKNVDYAETVLDWAQDLDKILKKHGIDPKSLNPVLLALSGDEAVEKAMASIAKSVQDKPACMAALNSSFFRTFPETFEMFYGTKKELQTQIIAKVKVKADQAEAIVSGTHGGEEFSDTIRFTNVAGQWYLVGSDAP